jgi:hypothetical protein
MAFYLKTHTIIANEMLFSNSTSVIVFKVKYVWRFKDKYLKKRIWILKESCRVNNYDVFMNGFFS